jgi:thiosulfate/3-mercaptopyruvate sulfurtransferase
MSAFGPLVSGAWLAEHLGRPNLRVIDFRWYLDGRSGRAAYEAGHIPGSVFVDLEEVTGGSGPGRHPLPEPGAFERAMRAAGVRRDSSVVVYDDQGGFVAGRLWWLLRYFGHDAAAVLDGGLQAWPGTLSRRPKAPQQEGDFVAAPAREGMALDYAQVRSLGDAAVLIDARAPERYRGEVEPIDPRAGHIPGARSAPWQDNLGPDGRFRPPAELRRRFAELGVGTGSDAVVYCGSGVSACHDLLALEVAGLRGGRLYAGSWSDWSSRADAPVATGEA